ncbi:MAG: YjjG family noncanonical pyrimidine nucleotidase [Clostridia bacterium]
MNKITTVFIDVDNTLLDFGKSATKAIQQAFFKYKLIYKDEYFEIFNETNDILWRSLEKGLITLDKLHEIRWVTIFEQIGIENVDGVAFDADFVEISGQIGIPMDGALEILQYLSEKYTVCVASNSTYNRQFYRLSDCKMMNYIDFLFTSEHINALKPSTEFFDACFKEVGNLQKNQVIMIGDSLTADIAGGKNYGIATCWYNHTKIENFDENIADFVVNNLIDIKNFL